MDTNEGFSPDGNSPSSWESDGDAAGDNDEPDARSEELDPDVDAASERTET